jgi:uncharacterized protein YdhG (YjbR/CyaY superfamily)
MNKETPIDKYIKTFPKDVQSILQKVRKTICEIIPNAKETISYGIPTFKLNDKYIIYFAGWKRHISLYPISEGTKEFNKKMSKYIAGRGTLKFPLTEDIPYDLISEVTKLRVKESSKPK